MDKSVLVFKTSVETTENVDMLKPVLDTLAGTGRWNFALDDSDRVLRVISESIEASYVIKELAIKGFDCCELDD